MNILAGDTGGTKTILAVVNTDDPNILMFEKKYLSNNYNSLEDIISDYLAEFSLQIDCACFAIAGPVSNGEAKLTNLSWHVSSEQIKNMFSLSFVKLLNDLEGVAYSIPVLDDTDLLTLHEGEPEDGGVISIVAPGTGLGEGFLTFNDNIPVAFPSEGSHVSFAPVNKIQSELLEYMWLKGFEHVSFERVCSGALGIPNIYDFIRETGKAEEPQWLNEMLAKSDDITPVIVEAAKDKNNVCEISGMVLWIFTEILAAECGNLALKTLSTGGIYLGGGIVLHILDELRKPYFLQMLKSKGRFEELVSQMPVKIILNNRAALLGAANYGQQLAEKNEMIKD